MKLTIALAFAMMLLGPGPAGAQGVEAGGPALADPQSEAECLAAGGRWARGGLSPAPLCFMPNPDAGAACSRATDCLGACLSESRTCAPERPIFGCYGFLDANGDEVMICVD